MTLFLSEDISICSFSNENVDYRKSYTFCYVSEVTLIESHSSAKDS